MPKYLICENCYQVVATVDVDALKPEIVSDMFASKFEPARGVASPWVPGVPAADMKCPMCPRRVFNVPNPERLSVSDYYDGSKPHFLELGADETIETEPESEPEDKRIERCPTCGRNRLEFKSPQGFAVHMHHCAKKAPDDVT